jgi:hypothetical protein
VKKKRRNFVWVLTNRIPTKPVDKYGDLFLLEVLNA